jgi:hypothetical protein
MSKKDHKNMFSSRQYGAEDWDRLPPAEQKATPHPGHKDRNKSSILAEQSAPQKEYVSVYPPVPILWRQESSQNQPKYALHKAPQDLRNSINRSESTFSRQQISLSAGVSQPIHTLQNPQQQLYNSIHKTVFRLDGEQTSQISSPKVGQPNWTLRDAQHHTNDGSQSVFSTQQSSQNSYANFDLQYRFLQNA